MLINDDDNGLLILGMGGTIDKDYPRTTMGYAFEIDEPAARRVLDGLRPFLAEPFSVQSICKKDSTEVNEIDRSNLLKAIELSKERRIVITHGTDTMIETAQLIQLSGVATNNKKTIALTGSMKPERFKDSDAVFNLGAAVSATSFLPSGSVVICMGGNAIPANLCARDPDSGRFILESSNNDNSNNNKRDE